MTFSADDDRLYATQLYGQKVRAIDLEDAPDRRHRGARCRALHLHPVRGWADAVRVGVGRREGPDARRVDAGGEGGGRGRRAPERDGPQSRRRTAVRRVRQHQRRVGGGCGTRKPGEQISVALGLEAPSGRRPTALALSPDGRTLLSPTPTTIPSPWPTYRSQAHEVVQGWIPVGWYPTGVLFDRDAAVSSCSTARD